jgi:cytochrome c oxidase assembly protein subunit 11
MDMPRPRATQGQPAAGADPGSVALVFALGFVAKIWSGWALAQLSHESRHEASRLPAAGRQPRMLGKLLVVVALMFGFGYALVPMYRAICEALGINVLSCPSSAWPAAAGPGARRRPTRRSTPRAPSPSSSTPTRAAPGTSSRRALAAGASGRAGHRDVRVPNMQNRTMAAQAIPSYAPKQASRTSTSSSASASTSTRWRPAKAKEWPVAFVIDPKLPKDVTTITLSYTFFEVGGKVPAAPAGPLPAPAAAPARRPDMMTGARGTARARSLQARAPCWQTCGRWLVVLRRAPLGRLRAGRAASSTRCTWSSPASPARRCSCCAGCAAGALGGRQRRGGLSRRHPQDPKVSGFEEKIKMSAVTPRGHHALLLHPAPSRHPVLWPSACSWSSWAPASGSTAPAGAPTCCWPAWWSG